MQTRSLTLTTYQTLLLSGVQCLSSGRGVTREVFLACLHLPQSFCKVIGFAVMRMGLPRVKIYTELPHTRYISYHTHPIIPAEKNLLGEVFNALSSSVPAK